jgi:hypothetical protein
LVWKLDVIATRCAGAPSVLGGSMTRVQISLFVATLGLVAAAACSSAGPATPSDDGPIGQSSAAITGATIVSNAEQWVNAKLHYCQAAYDAVDGDSSCWAWEGSSHRCHRESNAAWNPYRSDCSGFITWSWGLPAVGDGGYVTSDFAPFSTSFSSVIQATDLEPGDAANLTAGGHIVLFVKWTTKGSEAEFMEEPGCSANAPYAHSFTSSVMLSGSRIHIAYEGEDFTAIRYHKLTIAKPTPDYAASFVSQSFPKASTALKMFAGQTIPSYIEMKNTGAKTWDSKTRLGTSNPRDRASKFADSKWISTNRAAGVSGSVKPGSSYKFAFDLHAPSTLGTYKEYWNLVEDGVAWFSDHGQGGPTDTDLEANIDVVAGVRGNLDSATCDAIAGWTQDQASPDTAINVELYFDAPVGKTGAGSIEVPAGTSRTDLCTAIKSCDHGFSVPVPGALEDGTAHTVYAYGVANSGEGPNELLGGAPITFTCNTPAAPLTTQAGLKRQIVDSTSFKAWSFVSLDVVKETDPFVASYPTGSSLPATPTVVIAQGAPEVWVIDGAVRRHVVSPASLAAWAFKVVTWTAADVDACAQGADWPTTPFLMQGAGEAEVYVLDAAPGTPAVDAGVFDAGVTGPVVDAANPPKSSRLDASRSGGSDGRGGDSSDDNVDSASSSSGGGCSVPRTATRSSAFAWLATAGVALWLVRRRRPAHVARVTRLRE